MRNLSTCFGLIRRHAPAALLGSLLLSLSQMTSPAHAQMVFPSPRVRSHATPRTLPSLPLSLAPLQPIQLKPIQLKSQKPIRHIIVRVKPGVTPAQLLPILIERGKAVSVGALSYVRACRMKDFYVLSVADPAQLDAALATLRANPNVVYAHPDHHLQLLFKRQTTTLAPPNDYYWGKQDLEHLIVVLSGLDTVDTATQDDSDFWTYTWSEETVNALAAWQTYPGLYHNALLRKQLLATDPARLPRVAVIDTGVDMTHPDFSYTGNPGGGMTDTDVNQGGQINVGLARNFVGGDQGPDPTLAMDDFGHGTSVSGVIAAAPNNGIGIAGLGFPAQIVPVKVIDAAGNGDDSDLLDGITYAVDNKCLLINTSLDLDTTDYPQALQDVVDYAWNHGSLVISAAGNDGVDSAGNRVPLLAQTRRYPASLVHVLAVAASTYGGDTTGGEQLASYSNYGYELGVTAPGGDTTDFINTATGDAVEFLPSPLPEYVLIWTLAPTYQVVLSDPTQPDGAYAALGLYGLNYGAVPGTSFACPHVVGLAALYASANRITQDTPNAPQLIVNAIERGAQQMNSRADGGFDPTFGWGRIDAYNTINNLNARNCTVGGCIGQVTVKGTVIHNVQVTATLADGTSTKKYYGTTAPDGIFHIINMPAGRYRLTTSALGYSSTMNVTITAGCDLMGANMPL